MKTAGFFSRGRIGCAPLALALGALGALGAMSAAVSAPLIAGPAGPAGQAPQQPPVFQSSVEVTSIDATVFDGRGQAPTDLQPSDFTVRISGLPRRVVSAQWVPLVLAPGKAPAPLPDGYSGNENMTGGRLIVLAVDQPNIGFGANLPLVKMLGDFLDRLEPSDRVAAVALGAGAVSTPLTSDREAVKQALARMSGESRPLEQGLHNIAVAEAVQFEKHNTASMVGVLARECDDILPPGNARNVCYAETDSEAHAIVQMARANTEQTITRLRTLFEALAGIDAPKTLVLVSEGFPLVDDGPEVVELGALASAAHAGVYILQINNPVTDITGGRVSPDRIGDLNVIAGGLELLASATRGGLMKVTGSNSAPLQQLASQLSGYYLLGIESAPSDRDGQPHPISLNVDRGGLTVQSRRQFLVPPPETPQTVSPREAVVAGLMSPLVVSALPLRVATFSVREPESSKIQLIIHADVGSDYVVSEPVSLGYTIVDAKTGRVIDSQAADGRLAPVMRSVPSALQYSTSVSIDPGDYLLKLAVADGNRVGTVEHRIHAALVPAGPLSLSELMVGGPPSSTNPMRPTVGYSVGFGVVQGYLEAYGSPTGDTPKVKYEIAASADSDVLIEADAEGVPGGRDRTIFSQMMPVRQLPPGRYVLRAVVSSLGKAVKTLARPFEVETPAVLMTSAAVPTATSAPAEVYLPVADEFFARKFNRDEAGKRDTLRAFRGTVPPDATKAFDQGTEYLLSGEYPKAEEIFKSAIRPDGDVTAPMSYLAAVYAASGNDGPAAAAWQTALIDGTAFPEIYEWLGDTLIRTHELAQARTVLEEAVSKWPSDLRFAKPLALLYAVFGQGPEAVRTLERYLAAHQDDYETLSLGVEWMFHLHAAGAVAHRPADDVKLARGWADAYAKSKGPQSALVKEWMQALEKR
jgi:VWFA-related protein